MIFSEDYFYNGVYVCVDVLYIHEHIPRPIFLNIVLLTLMVYFIRIMMVYL